jgi:hypothetical protein
MPLSTQPPMARLRSRQLRTCALLWSALALASCANLELIAEDSCGNGVVEAVSHEDCDGQDQCGEPGTAHACQYLCDLGPDAKTKCPEGFVCGVDSVCRSPLGSFEVLSFATTSTALDLITGDLNADGCHEVVHTTRAATTVTAFESRTRGFCPASQQDVPSGKLPPSMLSVPAPMLADVTEDGRLDLLRPGAALFGDALFVHAAGPDPRVASTLYSTVRAREGKGRPLRVTYAGADAALLFIEDDSVTASDIHIPGVVNPTETPVNLGIGAQGSLDKLAVLQAADLGVMPVTIMPPMGMGSMTVTCADCDEVLIGFAGESQVRLLGVVQRPGSDQMALGQLASPVTLDSGTSLRQRNAASAVIDYNGDGALDLIVNAMDDNLHIAYGTGDGGFHSKLPVDKDNPDQHTSVLGGVSYAPYEDLPRGDLRFVVGELDTSAGPDVAFVPCPASTPLESPGCNKTESGCEALLVDIDGDKLLDLVTTDDQQPGLTVSRGGVGPDAHVSLVETQCPPHYLTAGDFDHDGIQDVAFFDQKNPGEGGVELEPPVTVLKIAYGAALAAPGEAQDSGRFDQASGLTAGRFAKGTIPTSSMQLYAARHLDDNGDPHPLHVGFSLIEGYGERQLFAPFYLPADPNMPPSPMGGDPSLRRVSMLAATTGLFGTSIDEKTMLDNEPTVGLAIVAEDAPLGAPGKFLWNVLGHDRDNSLSAAKKLGSKAVECDACVLVPIDLSTDDGKGDELLLLNQKKASVFAVPPATGGSSESPVFEPRASFATMHAFVSVDSGKYAPHPLVADLDDDGYLDVVVRAANGALVALWGREGGGFDENELVPPPSSEPAAKGEEEKQTCGTCSAAWFNAHGDSRRELIVVSPGHLGLYDLVGRELVRFKWLPEPPPEVAPSTPKDADPLEPAVPPADTDFTAVSAADLDGDGVDDLVIMPSSGLIITFRGRPVHE